MIEIYMVLSYIIWDAVIVKVIIIFTDIVVVLCGGGGGDSVYECYPKVEIIFIVCLYHVTYYLLAITHKNMLKCNIMVM